MHEIDCYVDILHGSQHRSTCADNFKKGCGNIKFMDNGCKFVIIILETHVVTCGTLTQTYAFAREHTHVPF